MRKRPAGSGLVRGGQAGGQAGGQTGAAGGGAGWWDNFSFRDCRHLRIFECEVKPMGSQIDEGLLDEKLAIIEGVKSWQPRLISKLESVIRSGDEDTLFRMNPIRFAREKGVEEEEAIDLFLHSVKAGLFRLNWQLWCPGCGGIVESFDSLRTLGTHYHCNFCQVNLEATLDDYIEITFALSPRVRDIEFNPPETLSAEDFFLRYIFHPEAYFPDGTKFGDAMKKQKPPMFYLEPDAKFEIGMTLPPGTVSGSDWLNRLDLFLAVAGEPMQAIEEVDIFLDPGSIRAPKAELRPGPKVLRFRNRTALKGAIILMSHPEGEIHSPLAFPPFLSGKRLFNSQTFRDLFQSETIQGEEGIAIKDITVLFTDLKSSTALYDRIGDLQAYHLVRQHFGSLARVINKHGGAIVKTIGDAVMATFLQPAEALGAALGMLDEIDRFNQSNGSKDIVLKIGIHKGSSIAVTLNERLDYFGQTVNVASRVQGLAGAEEIYITQEMYDVPEVRALIKDHPVNAKDARLKGIQEKVKVFRVRARPAEVSAPLRLERLAT